MKIVYLSPCGTLGGAERMLLDMLASMRESEPACELHLVSAGEGPLVEGAAALGVPTTVLALPAALARLGDAGAGGPAGRQTGRLSLVWGLLSALPSAVGYALALRRALRALGPDLLHTNGFKMHVLGALAAPRRTPVVWHIHDYVSRRPLMSRLLRRLSERCAVVVANSRSVAADVGAACGARLRVETIYNGVDVDNYSPAGAALDLDAAAGMPPAAPGTIRVGLLGTFARWKGHETFLRALALLPGGLPVRGYVAGGPLYQTHGSQYTFEELAGVAARLGISHRVGFTGFVDNSAAAMRALDVVVHASTEPEPFGLVIAEAMACGRAVIASRAGGAAELFDPEVDALAHRPGDADALAQRIAALAADAGLRRRLGLAGRATAVRRFDRARLARELADVYRHALGGPRPAGRGAAGKERAASRRLRVLHVHSGNLYGGVETTLLAQVRHREACPEMELSFALCFDGRFGDELAAAGAPAHRLGEVRVRRPLSVRRARRLLAGLLRRERFDVVVTHSAWSQAIFGRVARAAGLPTVFCLHGEARGRHWLERWAARTPPDLALCNSHFTAGTLPLIFPRTRAEVVYNPLVSGVPLHAPGERAALRASLDTPEDAVVIVQVGRMEEGKGHAVLLEALGELKESPGWVCWQVGGAQTPDEVRYAERLRKTAARLGVADRVRFTGHRADVRELLAAADIYCQPNTSPEGFGHTFIEALMAGLPVLTTDLGGAKEIVDESCGLRVAPDARVLAASLGRLINDPTLRSRLSAGGPARARQLCDVGTQMGRLRDLLGGAVRRAEDSANR